MNAFYHVSKPSYEPMGLLIRLQLPRFFQIKISGKTILFKERILFWNLKVYSCREAAKKRHRNATIFIHVENRIRSPILAWFCFVHTKSLSIFYTSLILPLIFLHKWTRMVQNMHFIGMARIHSFTICLQRCTDIRYVTVTSHVRCTYCTGMNVWKKSWIDVT